MNVDTNHVISNTAPNLTALSREVRSPQLIELVDIKAILYLGLTGEVTLPEQEHQLDIRI